MTTRTLLPATRSGFTLVEALIASTLLAVLFLAVAQTSSRASDAFDEGSAEHVLSTATHRALDRMTRLIELSDATILPGLQTADGADVVQFQVPVDFAGGVVTRMGVQIFAEREPGELDNDVDDDGDGLVDELRVVEVLAPGTPEERRSVLLSGVAEFAPGETGNGLDDDGDGVVDEGGLSFTADTNVVTVRLVAQRQDDGRRILTKAAETAVRLRN